MDKQRTVGICIVVTVTAASWVVGLSGLHSQRPQESVVKATSSKRDKSGSAPYLDKFEVALVEVGEWGSGCCDGLTRTLRH